MHGAIFVAPVLPSDVAMIAEALHKSNQLGKLVTRWAFTPHERAWMQRLFGSTRLTRRPAAPVPRSVLCRSARADLVDAFGRMMHLPTARFTDSSFALVDRLASQQVLHDTSAVLGREDACLLTFRRARELGKPALYQLQTAFCETVKRLLAREMEMFPEAFSAREITADFAPERVDRKRRELQAADHVLCPSQFVRSTVEAAGVSASQITTIPLGVDTRGTIRPETQRENVFLYVGNISARKGVHRLLRVWKELRAYRTHTLRLVGDVALPEKFLGDYRGLYEASPRLPREQLGREYTRAQAFVFNAMADGFGHVFAEAMCEGTPVLCSRNSGAPDLVTDGIEGRLYNYGDDDQLGSTLEWALGHPQQLAGMGERARQRVQSWGWKEFSRTFLAWFSSVAATSF